MENTLLRFKSIIPILLMLSIIPEQVIALKAINVQNCFETFTKNNTPSCSFQMSEEAYDVAINCVRPGVLQIIGDYKVVYINCSANYALDFKFDGHKPTEAIETVSWFMVEKNSGRKITSFHLDAKIFSIPSLHDHYVALNPQKEIPQRDSYNYSRTGSYVFSGYLEQERFQSKFYIFFEEKFAIQSFLRNEDVVEARLPNLLSETEEHFSLVIPCRPSHFKTHVTLQQINRSTGGDSFQFIYDATVGFTSTESLKSITEKNPYLNYNEFVFTCLLNQGDDLISFSTNKTGTKYGYNGLPTTSSSSIKTNVETQNNGSLLIVYACDFGLNSNGIANLAVHDVVNPVMLRLTKHFIFPIFNSRSYSTNVVNATTRFGTTVMSITTKSTLSNVLCWDATTFQAVTVGVGAVKRYIYVPLGLDGAGHKDTGNRPTDTYFRIFLDQPHNALYENQLVVFRSYVHSFLFIRPAIWYTVRANGSVIEEKIDYDWKEKYFSQAQIRLDTDVRKVLIAASLFWKPDWRNFSIDIHFDKAVNPMFDNSQIPIQKFRLNSNKLLKCSATGLPQPYIYWQKNGKNISSAVSSVNNTSILEFPHVRLEDAGDYVCVASNVASVETKLFTVQVFSETDTSWVIGISVSILICGVLATVAWVYFKLSASKASLSKSEIDDFLNGEHKENMLVEESSKGKEYAHDFTHLRPYKTEFEIQQNRFRIDPSRVLGSGAFGLVLMGTLDGVPVAVKTVKRNAEKSYLKALLSELKVMTFLGEHENIVGILGASTDNLRRGQVFIFVPFCALGNLQEYLRNNRRCFQYNPREYMNVIVAKSPSVSPEVVTYNRKTSKESSYITFKSQDTISLTDSTFADSMTTRNLYEWATQIAMGMEYLSSKKVLHGDLAARNVVLTENRIAKITDFGLSRRLYDYSEYAKTKQEPLPWRWMSLESLRDLTFSTKTDVWSYGITLWEIFSLGQTPYPGYSWTQEFVKELENGMRLSCPQFAFEELYTTVMKECWHTDPELRPSFAQIRENLCTRLQK